MKIILFSFCMFSCYLSYTQSDVKTTITSASEWIMTKMNLSQQTQKPRLAFSTFPEADGSTIFLGQYLSDEIASELSFTNPKATIINRYNLEILVAKKNIDLDQDMSIITRSLRSADLADILITGVIADLDPEYRMTIKLISLQNGAEIASMRYSFMKTPALVQYYNKKISKEKRAEAEAIPEPTDCPTGDFCFENTSKHKKSIWVMGNTESGLGRDVLYDITIQPGEKGCFYNLPARVYQIEITNVESGLPYDRENRQISVKKCAKEATLIPLKLR